MGVNQKLGADKEVKMKIVIGGLSVFLIFTFFCCSSQETEWQGSIEEVDGVTVVRNPKEPMYEEDIFSSEEELSIGESEGREEYMFQSIRYIAVDEQENIYILDRKAGNLKVFDKNGSLVRTIGKKGQGPGEFNLPGQVFIISEKELWVYDDGNRSFSFFTLDGDFIKSINASKAEGLEAKIDSKGNFSLASMNYSDETGHLSYRLDMYDKKLNYIKRIDSIPGTTDHRGRNLFSPLFSWAIDSDDNIVYGYQKEYKLKVFSTDGNLVKMITKEYKPVKITKEEIDERMASIQPRRKVYIPQYRPAFRRFSIDEEGRIFVMTWQRVEGKEWFYHDIIDSLGRYIAKIPLKGHPRVWKNGKFYTIEEDENGYRYVKRYKVTWKI